MTSYLRLWLRLYLHRWVLCVWECLMFSVASGRERKSKKSRGRERKSKKEEEGGGDNAAERILTPPNRIRGNTNKCKFPENTNKNLAHVIIFDIFCCCCMVVWRAIQARMLPNVCLMCVILMDTSIEKEAWDPSTNKIAERGSSKINCCYLQLAWNDRDRTKIVSWHKIPIVTYFNSFLAGMWYISNNWTVSNMHNGLINCE